ncbi:gluconokinase [Microbacterium protaetiae]|uniref:Gluconokinase n=1 Tax=Microbacterium protaetiae TaxID=2509458 RepID=A0A4P6EPJ5_9MICO|nr:gluconokinase [Microbacterium protaetiae]QAY59898.1 gluconokinase [Microbacterium protaetiae]
MTGDALPPIVVMGVSASGKTSVASALAMRLGVQWRDADDLHPPENVAKMASGIPLSDDDRWPWLDEVGRELAAGAASGGCIFACSALRRVYRDRLRLRARGVLFIHLTGDPELLAERAAAREDHYMPASLLPSQLAALEPLDADENGVVLDVAASVDQITDAAVIWLMSTLNVTIPSDSA